MSVEITPAPEPKIERIANLVNRIGSGDIKVPKFQRGFIWDKSQIIHLLESIYQGYPIGSVLFWLSEEQMKSEKEIGDFALPITPDKYPRNYILDGQQRLTSIYGVLKWDKPDVENKLNVYFDLQKKKFSHYTGKESSIHVPMSILFDTSNSLSFRYMLSEHSNSEELLKQFDILYETFREYLIPVVTIKEKTVESVCPIFERINSTGTQLDVFDLMVAATWDNDFDLNDRIDEIQSSTSLKNFDNIKKSTYLKMMSAIAGNGIKRSGIFKLRSMDTVELQDLTIKTKIAIERAVDFLSTDLNIPSDAFLPYEDQLIIFTYFFSKVKYPSQIQLESLRKWFWQTGFSEHFRGAAEGTAQKHISSIDSLIDGDNTSLHVRVSLVENDLLKRQFIKNSAFCKTLVLMFITKDPRNITNGEKIDSRIALSFYNKKEFHHIFPQDFLKEMGLSREKINNLCNICLLSSSQNKFVSNDAPSEYLSESIVNLNSDAEQIFKSNLIPIDESAGWRTDDYDVFLNQRAGLIIQEIEKLCE
ncbi:GmrSD restriction endonuclease domain-containing protein [Methanococcoides sp. LMO-2]|uniref:DUF262 domain-containing protein n=1 Tax=Methanococcoides cohabitans TaxID=3136559 RepID=A0ABU9KVK5_9EURY